MNIIKPEVKEKIEDLLARGYGIRETAKIAGAARHTVQKISDVMEFSYFCPILRIHSIKSPCEANLTRARKDKENGKRLSYTFEKCLECDGKSLEKESRSAVKEIAKTPVTNEPKISNGAVGPVPKTTPNYDKNYDKAVEVQKSDERAQIVQGKGEKVVLSKSPPDFTQSEEAKAGFTQTPEVSSPPPNPVTTPESETKVPEKAREQAQGPIDKLSANELDRQIVDQPPQPEWFTTLLGVFVREAERILQALEKATGDKMMAQDGLEILGHLKAQETVLQFLLKNFPSYELVAGHHTEWWKMYEKMWDWSARCME